jgi:hypothetical protein
MFHPLVSDKFPEIDFLKYLSLRTRGGHTEAKTTVAQVPQTLGIDAVSPTAHLLVKLTSILAASSRPLHLLKVDFSLSDFIAGLFVPPSQGITQSVLQSRALPLKKKVEFDVYLNRR